MSFVIDTGNQRLSWDQGKWDGDDALVYLAQTLVAAGESQPMTPTGPMVRCKSRPERNAWATGLAVCAVLGVDPGPTPPGAREPGDSLPLGVDA